MSSGRQWHQPQEKSVRDQTPVPPKLWNHHPSQYSSSKNGTSLTDVQRIIMNALDEIHVAASSSVDEEEDGGRWD